MRSYAPGSQPPRDQFVDVDDYVQEQGGRSLPEHAAKIDADIERLCAFHGCDRDHLLRMFVVIGFRIANEVPLSYDSIMGGLDAFRAQPGVKAVLPTLRSCIAHLVGLIMEAPDPEAVSKIYKERGTQASEAVQARINEFMQKKESEG